MARRFHKRFAGELALWQAQHGGKGEQDHLVIAASFARRREGTFDLIEVALMPVTAEWLPYETSDERYLIAKAVAEKRRFVKGLCVNLDADTPIASLVLKDTGEDACAVHIHDRDNEVAEPLEALLAGQGVAHQFWKEGEPLPARVTRPRRWEAQAAVSSRLSLPGGAAAGWAGDRAGAAWAEARATHRGAQAPRRDSG